MIAADIGAALKAHLAALVFSPTIPVAWPNRDFTPTGERFLAAQIDGLPNDRLTISGTHRVSGVLTVGAVIPAGGGTGQADGIADAVAEHFPCDLRLTIASGAVRITQVPSVRGGYRDGAYWRVPVTIPFEAFV